MIAPADAALDAAHRFYAKHRGEHLACDSTRLLQRCAEHLCDLLPISDRRAQGIARQAWAETEAKDAGGFIYADRTTSYLVVVQDNARHTEHCFTVGELLTWARSRSPAPV